MRLFQVITTYHLLSAITLQASSEEETILVAPKWVELKFPNIRELDWLFSRIIILDTGYRHRHSFDESDKYYSANIAPMESFSDIYLWGAQSSFGLYIAEKGVPFVFCEEATGMLSNSEILKHLDRDNPNIAHNYEYMLSMGLYSGTSETARAVLCNESVQTEELPDKEIINFELSKELNKLPEDKRTKIIRFFIDFDTIHVEPNSVMVFTQHLANLLTMTYEEQIRMYQLFADYYLADHNLVFKPHPDDLIPYSMLFSGAQVVREKMPSELLPYVLDNDLGGVATVYSTALNNLRGMYGLEFELDMSFEREFNKIHQYYFALKIVDHFSDCAVCYNLNERIIDSLADRNKINVEIEHISYDELELVQNEIIILDEKKEEDPVEDQLIEKLLDNNNSIVLLNTEKKHTWYSWFNRKTIMSSMKPLVIKKKLTNKENIEVYEPLNNELIFWISKDEKLKKEVHELNFTRELSYTGITVEELPVEDKDERIAILEGMLEATEARLLYYIEKNEKESD